MSVCESAVFEASVFLSECERGACHPELGDRTMSLGHLSGSCPPLQPQTLFSLKGKNHTLKYSEFFPIFSLIIENTV